MADEIPEKPKKRKTARRSFSAELTDLQTRVDTAVKLLKRAVPEGDCEANPALSMELAKVALDTLTSER